MNAILFFAFFKSVTSTFQNITDISSNTMSFQNTPFFNCTRVIANNFIFIFSNYYLFSISIYNKVSIMCDNDNLTVFFNIRK